MSDGKDILTGTGGGLRSPAVVDPRAEQGEDGRGWLSAKHSSRRGITSSPLETPAANGGGIAPSDPHRLWLCGAAAYAALGVPKDPRERKFRASACLLPELVVALPPSRHSRGRVVPSSRSISWCGPVAVPAEQLFRERTPFHRLHERRIFGPVIVFERPLAWEVSQPLLRHEKVDALQCA